MDENWKERASEEVDNALLNSSLDKHLQNIAYAKKRSKLLDELQRLAMILESAGVKGITTIDLDSFDDSFEFLISKLLSESSHQVRRDILLGALERCGLEEDFVKRLREIKEE